jgi:hypothetical protein
LQLVRPASCKCTSLEPLIAFVRQTLSLSGNGITSEGAWSLAAVLREQARLPRPLSMQLRRIAPPPPPFVLIGHAASFTPY